MKIPKTIKINGYTWKIRECDEGGKFTYKQE
jgi:hypothetical protein